MTHKHIRVSADYKQGQKRCLYKPMESINKCDGYVFSADIEKWMFSKVRKHNNYKSLF